MKNDIIRFLTLRNLKLCFWLSVVGFVPTYISIKTTLRVIETSQITTNQIISLIFNVPTFLIILYILIDRIIKIINPIRNSLFRRLKKFGNPDMIYEQLKNEKRNIIYENKNIIITENFILDNDNYENTVLLDDILNIYKVIKKRNFNLVDYYIGIIDCYNESYEIKCENEKIIDDTLLYMAQNYPKIRFGNNKANEEYVLNNIKKLP